MHSILQKKGKVCRFGLIGYPLGHSLSPLIHELIMDTIGVEGEYKLYELEPESLPVELPKLFATLDGFNCTIPHKEAVLPFLESLAPSASLYGAVNTVYRRRGYNTDGAGFAACGVPMKGSRVCVLGAGGVARVLTMEAVRAGAQEIVLKARSLSRAERLVDEVRKQGYRNIYALPFDEATDLDCKVILNGTPVGMWPKVGEMPVSTGQLKKASAVFDTIYNPTATRLVLQAKSMGIWAKGGLQMLVEQAVESQKIWNPEVDFDGYKDELHQVGLGLAKEVLQKSPIKIVLTGFMGSGKTYVGRALARALSLPFIDLDEVISQEARASIPEIFAAQGESGFRSLESEAFLEQLERPDPLVLAAGGGTLVQEGAIEAVRRAHALILYLDVPFDVALQRIGDDEQRPLLREGVDGIRNLYLRRKPLYEAAADLRVLADGTLSQIIESILTAFGWEQ